MEINKSREDKERQRTQKNLNHYINGKENDKKNMSENGDERMRTEKMSNDPKSPENEIFNSSTGTCTTNIRTRSNKTSTTTGKKSNLSTEEQNKTNNKRKEAGSIASTT